MNKGHQQGTGGFSVGGGQTQMAPGVNAEPSQDPEDRVSSRAWGLWEETLAA